VTEGTKSDPWELTTPPGSSKYSMYRDPDADPPALVCVIGSTTLKYHLSAVDELHAWLLARGDWVVLGAADENKPAADGTVEAWDARQRTRRWLVRTQKGLPGAIRDVPPSIARSPGTRRVTTTRVTTKCAPSKRFGAEPTSR